MNLAPLFTGTALGLPLAFSLAEISNCFITDEVYQQNIGICVSGVAITIVMVTYYLLRHHLDTTPLLTNPVKLIISTPLGSKNWYLVSKVLLIHVDSGTLIMSTALKWVLNY